MNEGIFSLATSVPFTIPASAPVETPARIPTGTGACHSVIKTAVITDESVITVPIERSMLPLMITKVTPSARMPFTAVAMRIPTTLSNWRKFGESSEKMRMIAMSAAKARSRWTASERMSVVRRAGLSAARPIRI